MPIYAYRCEACGFAKDVLQKISDPQLTVCLSCGVPAFKKQVTAAGFQLKGTGWYATDFRNGATSAAPAVAAGAGEGGGDAKGTDAGPGGKDARVDKGSDKGGDKGSDKGSDRAAPTVGASGASLQGASAAPPAKLPSTPSSSS